MMLEHNKLNFIYIMDSQRRSKHQFIHAILQIYHHQITNNHLILVALIILQIIATILVLIDMSIIYKMQYYLQL